MNEEQDNEFSGWAKTQLDRRAAALDNATRNALQQARRQAVTKRRRRLAWLEPPQWLLAGGFVTAAVAVIAFSTWISLPTDVDIAAPGLQDLDIIVSGEDLELYEELDFFDWLEQQSDETTEANGQA